MPTNNDAQGSETPPVPMENKYKIVLAIYFFILGSLLIAGTILFGWGVLKPSDEEQELRLAAIAAIAGGLGALIQSASSFIAFAGERKLYASWGWWYVMRPVVGAGLALIVYFALRGGLLSLSTATSNETAAGINVFGVGAICGIVGMFSKEATDKLKEIAEAIFKKEERADPSKKKKSPDQAGAK